MATRKSLKKSEVAAIFEVAGKKFVSRYRDRLNEMAPELLSCLDSLHQLISDFEYKIGGEDSFLDPSSEIVIYTNVERVAPGTQAGKIKLHVSEKDIKIMSGDSLNETHPVGGLRAVIATLSTEIHRAGMGKKPNTKKSALHKGSPEA